jgi:glucose-6-phosphate 1-dehydrogenase
MAETETAPSCTLVIFGATGDLTRRLLMPALRNLRRDKLLPEDFAIVGIASRALGDKGFRDHLRKGMEQFKGGTGPADIDWFLERSRYLSGKFEAPEAYRALAGLLSADRNVMFYLATPPSEFAVIAG